MTSLSTLAQTECQLEFSKTRLFLNRLPDGQNDYKPHMKSMTLGKLASHIADVPGFCLMTLNSPSADLATISQEPFVGVGREDVLAHFDQLADMVSAALISTSDDAFDQTWTLTTGPNVLFSGSRYAAYRQMGINHLIHHRAQLGTYLRSLEIPLPACYGPSADEAA